MYCFALMEKAFRIGRRNRLMLLMCMTGLSQQQRPQLSRRSWVWPRPQNWFCLLIANPALHFLWKEHFHVTHETFEYLCDLVRADLQKQQPWMRAPITVEERVGLALWRLATGNIYRSCGLQSGYGSLQRNISAMNPSALFFERRINSQNLFMLRRIACTSFTRHFVD